MVVSTEVEAASGCIGARMPPEAGDAARWPGVTIMGARSPVLSVWVNLFDGVLEKTRQAGLSVAQNLYNGLAVITRQALIAIFGSTSR